jgi:hypothetical protein
MAAETSSLERVPESLALSKLEASRMVGGSVRTIDRFIALTESSVRRLGRGVVIPRNSVQGHLRADHPTQAA